MNDPAVSAWRSWAEKASPELRHLFDDSVGAVLREVRHGYPAHMHANSHAYSMCKAECKEKLRQLAINVQGGNGHAVDQDC